ncbi:prepilin peptidase [Nocardioides rubriscoriae]|uniref:prepilin peptidase n=1 Tax=Nocardioides rubriscoriae TaxID=642762 RepID=UPI0011E00FF9|nr:A24 family peptidase [Nocardioides rubriscoriae]
MDEVRAAIVAAVVAAVLGYLSPLVVRRLPEPPETPDEDKTDRERARELLEGPKEPYAVVADLAWFAPVALVVCGVAGGLVGARLGWSWLLVGYVLLVPVVVALSIVDLRTRLLPAVVVLPALWTAIVLVVAHAGLVATWDDLRRGLVAMVVGYVFYWVLWFIYPVGLGYGDVRLAALLSLALGYLGWPEFLVGMYSGFLLLGVPGLVLAVVKRRASYLKTQFPFGPFMCVGALVGLLVGPAVLGHLAGG